MDSPPPGSYNLPFLSNLRGTKFGKSQDLTETRRYITPGPGSYETQKPFEKYTQKITFKSRIMKKIKTESPPPGAYSPVFTLTHNTGFKNISFGFGERSNLRKNLYDGPGPGSYDIQSKFDKIKYN